MRLLLILVFVLVILPGFALAETIKLQVANQDIQLSNAVVTIKQGETSVKEILKDNQIDISPSLEKTEVIVDLLTTPAFDFYGVYNGKSSILLFPIGYLKGEVRDEEDNLIKGAKLAFSCLPQTETKYPQETDELGQFQVPNQRTGECTVSASWKGRMGKETALIVQGEAVEIKIRLKEEINGKSNWPLTGVLAVLIAIALSFMVIYRQKNKGRGKKKAVRKKEELVTEGHLEILAKALPEKEKVLLLLLSQQEKEWAAQSALRYQMHLPRMSMGRLVKSLEGKGLVETEKVGKLIKLRLTAKAKGRG